MHSIVLAATVSLLMTGVATARTGYTKQSCTEISQEVTSNNKEATMIFLASIRGRMMDHRIATTDINMSKAINAFSVMCDAHPDASFLDLEDKLIYLGLMSGDFQQY